MTILHEVRAAHKTLRDRLDGALTSPPPGVNPDDLPSVPLIDLAASLNGSPEDKKAVAMQIRDACITSGFFQIKNHGIAPTATDGILEQAERFFRDLTPEQKEEIHVSKSELFRGYEPGDFSYVNPDDMGESTKKEKPQHETKEAFNWGYEAALDPEGSDGKYVELDGTPPQEGHTNVWPSEEALPGFHDVVKDYYIQAMRLCRHLFGLFALGLGLEETYFDSVTTHPGGIARLIHYPAQPEKEDNDTPDARLGLGAHTDYECFTLLLCSANPGLEILFPPSPITNGKAIWRPCPVRPGTITVNIADFFQRWTNGLYKSTVHRVMSKMGGEERYSVPLFFSINYDADVLPLPEAAVGKNLYKPMKAGQYVLERLRATKSVGEGSDDISQADAM
ncbi:putative flavonol synthase flavanone 3-hydroxylase [Phaeomoniella chlamydospora]|uniref:Putative flavonol synthase flavanone 3-hydroxylase n=1 Tax=Phaeomoniella chlamydospora TaxID=158046 RepID=A0A0G2H172_PHACM|nr:putative flavonol synthase flavanone 3-hydroxylase [Phaeomoniella chlamydospora]